jgi:hypothetical protein
MEERPPLFVGRLGMTKSKMKARAFFSALVASAGQGLLTIEYRNFALVRAEKSRKLHHVLMTNNEALIVDTK